MLAYSDNYKHNNLIYSQVVVIDVTTNGSTILENPEAGTACKKQKAEGRSEECVQGPPTSFPPPSSSYTHSGLLGLVWKARRTHASNIDYKATKCPSAQKS